MKLMDQWLASGDGRTLEEFVADVRAAARDMRHQARLRPFVLEQMMGMQNSVMSGIGLQNAHQQQLQHSWGGALGGALGGFGRMLGG